MTSVDVMPDRPVHIWQHAHYRELTLLKARLTNFQYGRHSHETYIISFVTKGRARVQVGRHEVEVPAHSTLVVNPEEWHDGGGEDDGECEYRNFAPSVDLLRQIAQQAGLDFVPEFPARSTFDPALARKLAIAHEQSTSPDELAAETSLLDALGYLVGRLARSQARKTEERTSGIGHRLKLYSDYVEANLSERMSLQRLAELAGVTRFQVIRDFNRGMGVTPSTFIRNRRVRIARQLIEAGTPLAEASFQAGFSDQSHLSRAFSAAHGVAPGAYRRARAGHRL